MVGKVKFEARIKSMLRSKKWSWLTMQDEDAKRPNREHDSLIGERSRIVNRMKAALVRLGIRGFNPKLKRATTRLDGLHTPEGEQSRPTHWLSCVATWSADGSSIIKSGRLRKSAWSVSSKRPVMEHTLWCAC